jgi:hypothetical protein
MRQADQSAMNSRRRAFCAAESPVLGCILRRLAGKIAAAPGSRARKRGQRSARPFRAPISRSPRDLSVVLRKCLCGMSAILLVCEQTVA